MSCRPCREDEGDEILAIINAAAGAYRGVIPADRWHEPYMPADEFEREIAAGVRFWGYDEDGRLIGVMGFQPVRRRAHPPRLRPTRQPAPRRRRALLACVRAVSERPLLIGTWAAADWAIAFYRRNGFELVSPERKTALLRRYWSIPERQIETSVVLAESPPAAA